MRGIRLHVVTGKGGTGKTTVAAALALALAADARGGRDGRVLLAEVEGRQGLAQVFDRPPLGADPAPLAVAPGGGEVHGLAVDVERAFLTYLDGMVGGLRRTRPLLRRFGVVEFATQVMPGLRDLLVIDPVVAAAGERAGGRDRWDAVVLDAPPTGRIARFLSVAEEIGGLAKVGGFAARAGRVGGVLHGPRTAVHLTTLLEPMPVQETLDAVGELGGLGYRLGLVVVNRSRADDEAAAALDAGVDAARLRAATAAVGVALDAQGSEGLLAQAAERGRRVRLEAAERAALGAAGLPLAELPMLADAVDLGALYRLAALLRPIVGEPAADRSGA